MHKHYKICKPYAEGLFEIAKNRKLLTEINDQLEIIKIVLKKIPEFQYFLANPLIDKEIKKNTLKIIFSKTVNSIILNFLLLLVDKKRIIYFHDIADEFTLIWNKITNTQLVEVYSVISLTETQKEYLINKLKKITRANSIQLNLKIDKALIGGLIIKFSSNLIDLSLKGQIQKLSLHLGTNLVSYK